MNTPRLRTMVRLPLLALVASVISCHFDKLFTGGGETPFSHDPPAGLAFGAAPGTARAGQPLTPILVSVVDSAGTRVAGADSLITVALGANPGGTSLIGTVNARAVNGVARFADLRINKPGTGYTLTATVAGLASDTSAAFDVMPEPMTSSVAVTTTTTGPSPDTDGYTATLDGGPSQAILPNGSVSFTALASGSHTVVLTDVAANCAVGGGNSKTVTVAEGGTNTAAFAIACPTPVPTTGDLTVSTTTGGTGSDPDGYSLIVDGASQPIATNDSRTLTGLLAGNHTVGLSGVATTCVVSGQNPRTINVPAGGANQTTFAITCTAPANLPPTAEFIPSCNQLDCSFTSTSSDPDGAIVSYSWNFGDGSAPSTAQNPPHSYAASGAYAVTLTVTDNQGAQDNVSHSVSVQSNRAPIVSAGPEQSVLVSALFSLDGASFSDPDHDGPWNVTIAWGDGTQTTFAAGEGTINRTHSYPVTLLGQDYQLTVTVEDAHGARASATKIVHVTLL
jgi:PKD repeat protein